jgi:hypothetical protein
MTDWLKSPHAPFRVTTLARLHSGTPWLSFWVNPSESQWRVATRTTIEQIQGGAIHHEWFTTGIGSQRSNTKFDQPVVNFAFQSGNIDARGQYPIDGEDPPENDLAVGLGNFFDFMDILNETTVLSDGRPNYVLITYRSRIFPHMELKGFFSPDGVQWTDSADSPNAIQSWGATFIVFASTPALDSTSLREHYFTQPYKY